MVLRSFILMMTMLLAVGAMAQTNSVQASLELESDTVALGRPFTVTFSIQHPSDVMVEFPTSRDFSPFELVGSRSEPTRTEEDDSWDVVHYQLRTFSLAPKQALSLPYTWFGVQDTGRATLMSDTLLLQRRIVQAHDSLRYRIDHTPIQLEDPPDYLRILLLGFAGLLILGGIGFLLRKPIRKFWNLRYLNRNWDRAKKALDRLSKEPRQDIQLEGLNSLWRSYLDPQHRYQISAMTTTELKTGIRKLNFLDLEDQDALVQASQLRDRVSFAGEILQQSEINVLIQSLGRIIDHTYEHRKEEIQD